MDSKLLELLSKGDFSPLKAHASTKKFYKGKWDGKTALLIEFELGKEERDNFVNLTNFFNSKGISVPQILLSPEDNEPFIITYFINGILLSQSNFDEEIFEKSLEQAKIFSQINPNFRTQALDKKRLVYEMDFFLLHFCETFANEKVSEDIKNELRKFSEEIDNFPKSFCHRDYHSENIIASGKNIYILDYQDALFAPRTYDFASLYVDGYYDFPKTAREKIKNYCLSYFGATEKEFLQTALQRALKALGTFGFQIVHRKKAKYLSSVKRTILYLDELSKDTVLESESLRIFLKKLQNLIT